MFVNMIKINVEKKKEKVLVLIYVFWKNKALKIADK